MSRLTPGKIVHLLGMGLVYAGLAICGWTAYRLSQGVVDGQIVTSAPMARIWWWGVAILLLGLPLFLSRWRTQRGGKILFDIAVGLFITFPILLFLDFGFGQINGALATENSRRVELPNPIAEGDEQLGYKNRPSAEIPTWFVENGLTTIEATYHTDVFGRRLTPTANEEAGEHLLFFGGSYTFGYLVADEQTLPSAVGSLAPGYQPYNYGSNGYGTQQTYGWLNQVDLTEQVSQSDGLAIYLFLGHHVRRVIGDSVVHNNWGHVMPHYELDRDGQLQRDGTMISGRPGRSILYGTLALSEMAKYFNAVLPGDISDADLELTTALIAGAKAGYQEQFGSDRFYVVIYPSRGEPRILPFLEEAGISYLNYADAFDSSAGELWLSEGHPSPAGYARVADLIVRDLELDAP